MIKIFEEFMKFNNKFKDKNGNTLPKINNDEIGKHHVINGKILKWKGLSNSSNKFNPKLELECSCGNVYKNNPSLTIDNWGINKVMSHVKCPRCLSLSLLEHIVDVNKANKDVDWSKISTKYKINIPNIKNNITYTQ